MNNKKGISAVVATVLIILITVAAVAIIWAAIIPMIKNQIQGSTVCLSATSQVSAVVEDGLTCVNKTSYNATTGNMTFFVQVSRLEKEFELKKIQVLISEAGSTKTFEITGTNVLGQNEDKMYYMNYTNTTVGGPDKVEVAPVVGVGNVEEPCGGTGAVVIKAC